MPSPPHRAPHVPEPVPEPAPRSRGRREVLRCAGLAALGLTGVGLSSACGKAAGSDDRSSRDELTGRRSNAVAAPPSAEQAWVRLAYGNARFAAGHPTREHQSVAYRREVADRENHHPIACVLGCVDTMAPPSLIFDVGIGDLATVSAPAETVDENVLTSVEYAVERLGVRLVIVLGHTDCAIVRAAIDLAEGDRPGGRAADVAEGVVPAVRATPIHDTRARLAGCVATQASRMSDVLGANSTVIRATRRRRFADRRVDIVPVVYDPGTGLIRRVRHTRPWET